MRLIIIIQLYLYTLCKKLKFVFEYFPIPSSQKHDFDFCAGSMNPEVSLIEAQVKATNDRP